MTDLRTQLQAAFAASSTGEFELGLGGMATVFLGQDLRHEPAGRAHGAAPLATAT